MKKLLLLTVLLLFIGCEMTPDATLTNMKKPVVLLGVIKKTGGITLLGADGKTVSINGTYILAKAISESHAVGDTIIK